MSNYPNQNDHWGRLRQEIHQTSASVSKPSSLSQTANENMYPSMEDKIFIELADKGETVYKLRLEFANGNRFFFPYAYLLYVSYDNAEGMLKIFTAQKEIIIRGRGLDQLEEYLYENVVKSIKESKIALVKEKSGLCIKQIEIVDRF